MKKIFAFMLLLFVSQMNAQQLKLYPEMCDALQRVFCDYVSSEAETKYISGVHGQYVGQLISNVIYGWGYYLSDDDSQTFGQFRKGKHVFGITLVSGRARVGGEEHYVEYDMDTGRIIKIHTIEGDMPLAPPFIDSKDAPSPYSFRRVVYSNGDVYCGEMYNGHRHGYGVYYWADGDFWYGEYRNGYRQGFGALFKTDHRVFYGKWVGDSKVE